MESWMEDVKRDLAPFGDPGAPIRYSQTQNLLVADWLSRGASRSATFHSSPSRGTQVTFEGFETSFRAFLAGPKMSDLLGVARMMLQTDAAPFFVTTRGQKQNQGGTEQAALTLLDHAATAQDGGYTNVVFVTGAAGAGKTEVLKQLVRRQAERFTRGEADFLFLYVNAQGRALARLDEALATEIQDLRATNLTYHVVPTLARNGNLVPVIDGFDELLGVLGYEDAFSSLRRFLDDLGGRGSIIASARSVYYQQEFLARSGRDSFLKQGLRIDPLEILPWREEEFRRYLELRFEGEILPQLSHDEFRSKMVNAFSASENQALKTKPFFVSKMADLILNGTDVSGGDLLNQMVNGYIERERTEKLLDRTGRPLLTSDQISQFVQTVCEEMWMTEARSLDSESVRILAELAFPSGLERSETDSIVMERAPTMAFLAPAAGRARVEFEHELFFSYFLGKTVEVAVQADARSLYSVLSRSVLPENTAEFAAMRLWNAGAALNNIVNACSSAATLHTSRSMQGRENAGSIVAAFLRVVASSSDAPHGSEITFQGLVFAGGSFNNIALVACKFIDVEWRRVDLTGSLFLGCVAERVGLHETIVEPETTRLEFAGLDILQDVYGIRVRAAEEVTQVFRHDLMLGILIRCGLPVLSQEISPVDPDILDLLEKLLRKFERSNLIWPLDQENRQVMINPKWPALERLMIEAGIISEEQSIPHKGSPRRALRRNFLPQQIMSGDTNRPAHIEGIRKFWAVLRQRYPSKRTLPEEISVV